MSRFECPLCHSMNCGCRYFGADSTLHLRVQSPIRGEGESLPIGTFEAEPTLRDRYHAALNEVETHARSTARSILELLREFEKATGAEVAEVTLDRAYAYGVPPELKIVDLKLNPTPAARVRVGKEGR